MKKILILAFIGVVVLSCSCNDDTKKVSTCDFETLINAEQFVNAPSHKLEINSLNIEGDCLKIKFSSGGCSGNTWELKFIDSGYILESDPPQRSVRLSLKNEELCEAYIAKELTFDISVLQVDGNIVKLNIVNSNENILYQY